MTCERCRLIEDECVAVEAEGLTRDALRWRMRAEGMHRVIVDFCESVERAAHHWGGPRGGQHVPYHGDWACTAPSVRQRLEWWARHLRAAAKEGEGV